MTDATVNDPGPTDRRTGLQSLVTRLSKDKASDPITFADRAGAFEPASMPFVFPLVVDTMTLRNEILRHARTQGRTVLANGANIGTFRLFCADHVVAEVDEHLEEWATTQTKIDYPSARLVWQSIYQPLLRCVDVPAGLTTTSETALLADLGDPTSRYGDLDDVPTATLAVLLNAPLLSKDRMPLRAVYGDGFDHLAHAEWLAALRAGGDLGPIGGLVNGSYGLASALGIGTYQAVRALARRVPWPWLLIGAVVGGGTFNRYVSPGTKEKVLTTVGTGLGHVFERVAELAAMQRDAADQFGSLSPLQESWRGICSDIGPTAALQRMSLQRLARAPGSHLSAAELAGQMTESTFPHGKAKVRGILRDLPCFVQPYRGRFQVGRSLMMG